MADFGKDFVREPATSTPQAYARRVHLLAVLYLLLVLLPSAGLVLLVWRGKFFVTLTQRSNVETLTLAFFLLFFAYIVVISLRGAAGALRLAWFTILTRLHGQESVEARKMDCLRGRPGPRKVEGALNFALQVGDGQCAAFRVPIRDSAGDMGFVAVDGVHICLEGIVGSNNLLAYFCRQLQGILRSRGDKSEVDIVEWKTIDDESAREYLGLVRFALNLEAHLKSPPLWPRVILEPTDLDLLAKRLSEVCPALRNEAFLPDWEFVAEHKLPIIPEPLGFASLSRSERRADPVASLGLAAIVVGLLVGILAFFIAVPPWVPGV